MKQGRVFKTSAFEFLVPDGWAFLESESQPDRVVFQSADGQNRLTLSVMDLQRELTDDEAHASFVRLVEHRRTAESLPSSQIHLTDYQITGGDGYLYTKWGGREAQADRRTATLVTIESKKIFTLYVESIHTSDEALNTVSDEVFANFKPN